MPTLHSSASPDNSSAAITWNTDVNAPCCPGEIVDNATGQTLLAQTDWDYPSIANTFGWCLMMLQVCHKCGEPLDVDHDVEAHDVLECNDCDETQQPCQHNYTDGTIDCPDCKLTASDFITAAGNWLRDNDGVTADDPGYFSASFDNG